MPSATRILMAALNLVKCEFNHGDSENTRDSDSMAHDPSVRSYPLPANDLWYYQRHKKKKESGREREK